MLSAPARPRKLASVPGVEIFATGSHRGKPYRHADLKRVVRNFETLSTGPAPILTPTTVIGHEERQELLENTGVPAAGVVGAVRYAERPCKECGGPRCTECFGTRRRGLLVADFADMAPEVADLINQKSYRKVSSELYDDFEHGGRHYGLALRRVALLGGELPQIKGLEDIPLATFSEGAKALRTTVVHHFAERHEAPAPAPAIRVFRGPSGRLYFPGLEKFAEFLPTALRPGGCPSRRENNDNFRRHLRSWAEKRRQRRQGRKK